MSKCNKGKCTLFWDVYRGIDISECCYKHDKNCSFKVFYTCLKTKLSWIEATLIGLGGAIGCIVKYPKKMFDKL